MKYQRVLIVSDNPSLVKKFKAIVADPIFNGVSFYYCYSFGNPDAVQEELASLGMTQLRIKEQVQQITQDYDLLISLHCKQLFPANIIEHVKCINIHPGYNPFNRGWYPQVFSIINKQPFGVTIHEMDNLLDHGPIIAQKIVPLYAWDTSLSAYERATEEEINLLKEYIPTILGGVYATAPMSQEGNVNYKKDYQALCPLALDHTGTLQEHIDLLRALSHGVYKNAFFVTPEGRKYLSKWNWM